MTGEQLDRIRADYEQHIRAANDDAERGPPRSASSNGACGSPSSTRKRQAVTELRDANEIDDIVLRELQAAMDIEEVRLLGPVPSD